jgi:hypothetical protein
MRILSLSDTITTCDCCGRQNLKKTVILTESDDRFPGQDDVMAYGSQCAATALRKAGVKGFKNHVTNAAIEKQAYAARSSFKVEVVILSEKEGGIQWAKNSGRYIG